MQNKILSFGDAPLRLDLSALLFSEKTQNTSEHLEKSWKTLSARFDAQEVGFFEACHNAKLNAIDETLALVSKLRAPNAPQWNDCLFLGIGGSSLGPSSLLSCLTEKATQPIRFHFVENPDPVEWNATLSKLNPDTTLVCIVTKSGTTFETLAQALCAMEWLGPSRVRSHTVAITDPTRGDLRALVQKTGIASLPIHPSIGGRFSIFSPVGLFPAALAGLDVRAFLQGAQEIRSWVLAQKPAQNPLFCFAESLIQNASRYPIHVLMPYSTPLRSLGPWFAQLWAESLGKGGKGFTPLSALGATDQHSILQLLRDGPDDKITWFVTVDEVTDPVRIPKGPLAEITDTLPAFKILQNHSLQSLLDIEYRAISKVFERNKRPQLTWTLKQIDERNLGSLYYLFCVLTAVTGTLWGVDPFDQPGVEEGKVYIREALTG